MATSQSLGALARFHHVVAHLPGSGTYTVQATATDTSGFSETVQATITILPAQPPTVQVTPSNPSPKVNETIIVRAQVSGNTSSIIRYDWNFGPGASMARDHPRRATSCPYRGIQSAPR